MRDESTQAKEGTVSGIVRDESSESAQDGSAQARRGLQVEVCGMSLVEVEVHRMSLRGQRRGPQRKFLSTFSSLAFSRSLAFSSRLLAMEKSSV